MDSIGCCGDHLKCQTTGICTKNNGVIDYGDDKPMYCLLWSGTIKTKFPLLYALKGKGAVTIETNRLTPRGKQLLLTKYWGGTDDVSLTLTVIFFTSADFAGNRINPQAILRQVAMIKRELLVREVKT